MTNIALPYDSQRLHLLADEIIRHAGEMARMGWTPATSSNFSQRLDHRHAAITVSGRDKGHLTHADIMVVDLDGNPAGSEQHPSAETLLHTQIYRKLPHIGCVLHTHSRAQTVASRLFANTGHVHLAGYELLKALHGNTTHETAIDIPILPNTQDIPALAAHVEALLDRALFWGYLIDGHGLYVWGHNIDEARRHLEAFEFLLHCELELRKYSTAM
ncbi:MAG: methylthioribulose 1-phosphate dehydratase [Xanthomonadaceae bacterium]|jgi:methylthioribulose-1-phosphate dehydratase|nr:methylthioribulose 1-phosphate dehydratase [Xanthomonadaceae bacterium]